MTTVANSRHIVVGTAGHIDHGKSALVQALTGVDPDRLKEEKERGITIDLGFAHWQEGDLTVAFVDVPGHERFVKNMLAGVAGIDAVLLVVAADEGVMPQTREHLDICRLLAIPRGVIALTKSDLADPDMLELVRLDVAELVGGTALANTSMIPVSARSGAGLDDLRRALRELGRQAPERDAGGPVRLAVDRVFSMRGFGTVVTGTLARGRIAIDQELDVTPGTRRVKVRGVQVHGAAREGADAGERVAVNLAGVEVSDLERGQVLVTPGSVHSTSVVDASAIVLASGGALRHGARVRFHHGTGETLARVAIVGPAEAAGDAAPSIGPGETGAVRLRLERPVAVTRGDRFVLRRYSPAVTIAGGRVLDPAPPRVGVRLAATRARLAQLNAPFLGSEDEASALRLFVADAGAQGIVIAELAARGGTEPSSAALARVQGDPTCWQVGGRLLRAEWRETLAERVLAVVAAHHDAQPLSEGVSREEVRDRALGAAHPEVAAAVLEDLARRGAIRGSDRLALAGRGVTMTPEETAAHATIAEAYRAAGLMPPETQALGAATGLAAPLVERVTQLLLRQQVLTRVDAFVFHRDALARLKADVVSLKAAGTARVDVAAFKERYGLTRKYAIPLLEYLDRERVTRRVGESRVIL